MGGCGRRPQRARPRAVVGADARAWPVGHQAVSAGAGQGKHGDGPVPQVTQLGRAVSAETVTCGAGPERYPGEREGRQPSDNGRGRRTSMVPPE